MPNIQFEDLEKGKLKITFTLNPDETQPYLESSALELSEKKPLDGFRPGKAPFEIVRKTFGDSVIFENAIEHIIRSLFVKTVIDHQIDTVGSPSISVEKMAFGNDLVFTTEVTKMPKVLSIPEISNFSIKSNEFSVTEEEINQALKDLQRMQTKEVRVSNNEAVDATNKVVIKMEMLLDSVVVEGGSAENHVVFMMEEYYIPGFKEELIGLKEGESKVFTLSFPKEHNKSFLAGKSVEFHVDIKEIFTLQPPELNDEFAKSLGARDFEMLKELISKNLLHEKTQESEWKIEKDMLEQLSDKTQIEDIPDLLLNEEIEKMIQELKHNIEEQGADFNQYLASLKKTLAQIKLDFTPQAIKRIKVALLLKELAKQQKIEISEQELHDELDKIASNYTEKEMKDRIYSPEHQQYLQHVLINRKIILSLKEQIVKK